MLGSSGEAGQAGKATWGRMQKKATALLRKIKSRLADELWELGDTDADKEEKLEEEEGTLRKGICCRGFLRWDFMTAGVESALAITQKLNSWG